MGGNGASRLLLTIGLAAGLAVVGATLACTTPLRDAIEGARLYGAGTRALDRGDPAAAIDRLERAARLVPHASEIRHHLGLAYQAAGEPERARAELETAVALDCENLAARRNLARLEATTGAPGAAFATPGAAHAVPGAALATPGAALATPGAAHAVPGAAHAVPGKPNADAPGMGGGGESASRADTRLEGG